MDAELPLELPKASASREARPDFDAHEAKFLRPSAVQNKGKIAATCWKTLESGLSAKPACKAQVLLLSIQTIAGNYSLYLCSLNISNIITVIVAVPEILN